MSDHDTDEAGGAARGTDAVEDAAEVSSDVPVTTHEPDAAEVEEGLVHDAEEVAESLHVDGDAAGSPGAVADPAEWTAEQLDALVAERDQFLAAYQRTAADFDNFRKLSRKRIGDETARVQGAFVERMLPVLDAVDAARTHGGESGDEGVEALAKALFGFLEKEGLERVDPEGEVFDPNHAEAVMHEPGDEGDPVVTEVLRTGYLWNGRVIRPAMVKVAG